jgi:hypothetical protein
MQALPHATSGTSSARKAARSMTVTQAHLLDEQKAVPGAPSVWQGAHAAEPALKSGLLNPPGAPLATVRAMRGADECEYIFGFGSLIWRPGEKELLQCINT